MKMVNAKGEAVYFNRAWKHGKETWVVQGIGETLVIGRDRQKLGCGGVLGAFNVQAVQVQAV